MKQFVLITSLVALFVFAGCGGSKKESNKVVYEGEMIELLTPQPNDTFSWALVTGRASVKHGYFDVILQGDDAQVILRRGVPLAAEAPDTVTFEIGIALSKEMAPTKARLKAPISSAEKRGAIVEAVVPVFIKSSSADAHAAVVRFYNALDTNDLQTAYSLLVAMGRNYPNLYGGEAVFAPRPKRTSDLKTWKRQGERLRLLTLQPLPLYDLPQENLFCYRARVEHRLEKEITLEATYVFLVRQTDGSFLLYRPRREPHRAD